MVSRPKRKQGKTPRMMRFEVRQGGQIVASGEGPAVAATAEGIHYARVYAQDGPVKLTVKPVRKRRAVVAIRGSK